MGLIGAGSVVKSLLNQLPSLQAKLGPVKSASFATARRLVSTIRAGYAVPNCAALQFCPVIWVAVPESNLSQTVRDLAAQADLQQKQIVLYQSEQDSSAFPEITDMGARIATLNPIEDVHQSNFIAEGHQDVLRLLRRMLEHDRRKLIELHTGAKAGYFASLELVTHLLGALTTSALNSLQHSGMERMDAVDLVTSFATRTMKSHSRAGAKPWSQSELRELRDALERRTAQLQPIAPLEADVYAQAVKLALEYFERLSAPPKARSHHA
jgi:hypothetical protein